MTKGGKLIGSGGYGCVFRPPLKCKGKNRTKKRMVSKLMTVKHAKSEYEEIMKFKRMLRKIPNYSKYFLLDNISICKPDEFSEKDLHRFDEKCNALNDKYSKDSINERLDELSILNIPDGGTDLKTYIKTVHYSKLSSANERLINLLVHGIVPMNKNKVLHADLKDSNILMNDKDLTIIDWGLSVVYKPNEIPDKLQGRSVYYNIPFTSILFNSVFEKMYSAFLKENETINYKTVNAFVKMYIQEWFDYRGNGHYNIIKQIIASLFVDENLPYEETSNKAMEFIEKYVTVVIMKYTDRKKMDLLKYYNEVYIHIVDIWGFLTIYLNMFESLANNYTRLTSNEITLFHKLKAIVLTYMYEPRITPINVSQLVFDLKSLNPIFLKCTNQQSTTDFSHFSSSNINLTTTSIQNKGLTLKPTRKKR
jgi:serine/threonine protein kinase